jgi:hypothetical protein
MNKKQIKKTLSKKLKDWIETIDNNELKIAIQNSVFVAGGAIASLLTGEEPKDFDVYFDDLSVAARVARYYADIVNKKGINVVIKTNNEKASVENYIQSKGYFEYIKNDEKNDFPVAVITSTAIGLFNGIQIITKFVGKPDEIVGNFDFIHTKNCYKLSNDGLVLDKDALVSLLTKELKYTGSKYPVSSMIRTRKFIKRGWNINAGEYLKMMFDINSLDLKDRDILREQLIGVDMSYFSALIERLQTTDKKEITGSYICELIDEIFD